MGIYCVVCLNCLFILVHTFVRKGKERELWWVKFSFPSGYQWIQDRDSHKHDRELTLAAPWWARCAAPSPGSPPSEPLHVPPTLVVSSLPPRCQPGGGDSEVEFLFFRFAWTLDLELVVSIYHWTQFVLTSSNCWNAQKFHSSEFTWFASQI